MTIREGASAPIRHHRRDEKETHMNSRKSTGTLLAATILVVSPVMAGQLYPVVGALAQAPAARSDAPARSVTDDREIALRVQAALAKDKEVAALKLSVKATAGVVELTGTARDDAKVKRALELARNVPGVKSAKYEVVGG